MINFVEKLYSKLTDLETNEIELKEVITLLENEIKDGEWKRGFVIGQSLFKDLATLREVQLKIIMLEKDILRQLRQDREGDKDPTAQIVAASPLQIEK